MKIKKNRTLIAALCVIFCICALTSYAEKSGASSGKKQADIRRDAKKTVKTGTKKMSDKELINYLLSQAPEANRKVKTLGMTALVTGETTDLGDIGLCRDVWLGTNHEENFVREILYLISGDGTIYEYDPVGDGYNIVN